MFSITALALLGALAGAEPQDRSHIAAARTAYRDCLLAAGHEALAAGRRNDLTEEVRSACRREEQAFLVVMVNWEMAAGTKRADATEAAQLESEEIQRIVIDAVLLAAEPTGPLNR